MTIPDPKTIPRPGTRFVIASTTLTGRPSAARTAARMNLSLRDWVSLPDPGASGVRVFALVPLEILAVLTPPRYEGETD